MASGPELLGLPLVYTYKGKEYKVARKLSQEMEQELCDWVFYRAMDRLERQRELNKRSKFLGMTEVQYQRAMDRLIDNHEAGRFEWEGDLLMSALAQLPGDKRMALLRFQAFDPTVKMELIEEIYKSQEDIIRLSKLVNPQQADGEKEKEATQLSATA